ncbi:MAG: hypothetical protein ACOYOB_21630 [Myxococcota bacterium]
MLTKTRRKRVLQKCAAKEREPDELKLLVGAGALAGAGHGYARPHSIFAGGVPGHIGQHRRKAGMLLGATIGAGLGWLPEIAWTSRDALKRMASRKERQP